MNGELKNVEDQVVVITGASSGIGLTTARMAAERGVRLVFAARSEDALEELTEEIIASCPLWLDSPVGDRLWEESG
jgi:NADP-dependent 3-hydroxy acid dehydrogenase YdfG